MYVVRLVDEFFRVVLPWVTTGSYDKVFLDANKLISCIYRARHGPQTRISVHCDYTPSKSGHIEAHA